MTKASVKASKEQMDILIKDAVARHGHHGVKVVTETIRQKYNIAVDPDYVTTLLKTK